MGSARQPGRTCCLVRQFSQSRGGPEAALIQMGIGTFFRQFLRNEKGGVLLEAVVAVGLIGLAVGITAQGLTVGSRGTTQVRKMTSAQNIARSQMAQALAAPYCEHPCSYNVTGATGYTVTAATETFLGADSHLQYVAIAVSKNNQTVVRTKGLKVNR